MAYKFRSTLAGLFFLWILSGGDVGLASDSSWRWIHRAFAPSSRRHRDAKVLDTVLQESAANEAGRPIKWVQRAMAPTSSSPFPGFSPSAIHQLRPGAETPKSGRKLSRVSVDVPDAAHPFFGCDEVVSAGRIRGGVAAFVLNGPLVIEGKSSRLCMHKPSLRASKSKMVFDGFGDAAVWAGQTISLMHQRSKTTLQASTSVLSQPSNTLETIKAGVLGFSTALSNASKTENDELSSMMLQSGPPSLRAYTETEEHGDPAESRVKSTTKIHESSDPIHFLGSLNSLVVNFVSSLHLPVSVRHVSGILDLFSSWQKLDSLQSTIERRQESVDELVWGKDAKSYQGQQSEEAFLFWTGKSFSRVIHNLSQVQKAYSDSATWLYSRAVELDPRHVPWIVAGASQATMDKLNELNSKLAELIESEIYHLFNRFDRELMGLKRQSQPERANPPSCMVMSASGEAQLLKYGSAIPQLLYDSNENHRMFDAPMMVALDTDEDGNLYLGTPESNRGTPLPLASDVFWMRQMASYANEVSSGSRSDASEDDEPRPVTVAAVTLPVNSNGDVLVTQRAFRGMYDGMWVFPGGHVDGGEALSAAAVREVLEETGLRVVKDSLRPLAVWEGAVTSKKRQFCVVFFAADVSGNSENMFLQTKEVHRAAWIPADLLPRMLDTHVLHENELEGCAVVGNEQESTKIKLSELQKGLGEGHKFALRAYLESRKEDNSLNQDLFMESSDDYSSSYRSI
mmetsp:Transcript_2813/g.6729  ORF Transcript_2813/g.6729 Transcript_2813/m.6729 type:complete len:740 (-) Transcript_2813:106-2325(-)|eukprot:624082-Hanusia_phi.AAC.3